MTIRARDFSTAFRTSSIPSHSKEQSQAAADGILGEFRIVFGNRLLVVEEDLDATTIGDRGEYVRWSIGNRHARLKAEDGLVKGDGSLDIANDQVRSELGIFHGSCLLK